MPKVIWNPDVDNFYTIALGKTSDSLQLLSALKAL